MTYSIGILGAGNVGKTLGLKWASKGHKVTFGIREPSKYSQFANDNPNITVTFSKDVVATHKLLVLALPGRDLGQSMSTLGDIKGKQIIDATNMYGMRKLQEQFPQTSFVKAFNHIGYNVMDNPVINDNSVTLLYCGDDSELLDITHQLAQDCGFEPFCAGNSSFAVDLENYALLWIKLSRSIGRNFGFKILKID